MNTQNDMTGRLEKFFEDAHEYHEDSPLCVRCGEHADTGKTDCAPKPQKHYIVMAGLHGCLPNYCGSCETLQDAVEDLAQLSDLGRTRKATLKRDRYLELNMDRDGNEYCEIITCICGDPDSHNDN